MRREPDAANHYIGSKWAREKKPDHNSAPASKGHDPLFYHYSGGKIRGWW